MDGVLFTYTLLLSLSGKTSDGRDCEVQEKARFVDRKKNQNEPGHKDQSLSNTLFIFQITERLLCSKALCANTSNE
jgi:hypothetical protein